MENIWKDGTVVTDGKGDPVYLDSQALTEVLNKIKADNGKNIVAVYTEKEFSEEQYIEVYEQLEDILTCDSGDAEYRACKDVLGDDFDVVWKVTRLLNGKKDYDMSFPSFEEAWGCAMKQAINSNLVLGEQAHITVPHYDGENALINISLPHMQMEQYEVTKGK